MVVVPSAATLNLLLPAVIVLVTARLEPEIDPVTPRLAPEIAPVTPRLAPEIAPLDSTENTGIELVSDLMLIL
jgi:hypothetical protein